MHGRKWGAHRVGWVIDHEQSLVSWHRLGRTCQVDNCVRPSHLTITRGIKPKGRNGKAKVGQYILRLGNGKTVINTRRRFTYGDLEKYLVDLKELLSQTTYLNSKYTQILNGNSQLLKYIGEIDPPTAEVITQAVAAAVAGPLGALEQRMDALSSRMEEMLDHVERPAPEVAPEPSAPEPTEPPAPAPSPPVEPVDDNLRDMLMQVFQAEMSEPQEPTGDDHEALGVAFDMASAGSEDTSGAVRLFATWLTSFRKLTAENDTMERSPATFAAQVVAGSLA